MIRDAFLSLLHLLIGRDGSDTEISAAAIAYKKLRPEGIEQLWAAMNWSDAEQDLMCILMIFFRARRRAPSWSEFQEDLKEHIRLYGTLMTPEERTSLEGLLTQGAKIAGFKAIKPGTESTKPATPDSFKRVQQISQETPKPVQQQKPKKPKAPPIELELPDPIKPEILPTTQR
jgi:hypothetical protein